MSRKRDWREILREHLARVVTKHAKQLEVHVQDPEFSTMSDEEFLFRIDVDIPPGTVIH